MLIRFRSSLTLRIFAITCALMMAICLLTYGAIAYLTPISYTNLLEGELNQATDALLERLSGLGAAECEAVLTDFSRETGAQLYLEDGYGNVLYDTYEWGAENADVVTAVEGDYAQENAAYEAEVCIEEVVVRGNGALAGTGREFLFQNGESGFLLVQGGRRAVNQTSEAMKRILPYLLLLILAGSMLISFFYARMITRPIVSISDLAARIAAQDFSARWHKKRRDEIGRLGESLNLLSDNLSGALSDLRDANAQLRQDIDREREMEEKRTAFFSAASHELKTPVTILKGQLSGMLAQIGVYRDREKYLSRALAVTGRMEALIQEILTISRIDAGSFSMDAQVVNLSALVKEQIALDEELLNRRKLTLDAEIKEHVQMRGNANLLANALDNVLMNAILYSPEGARIRIELREGYFRMENSGAHIPEEAINQLFTPFYRVEQSRNRKSGGSGLGLYLVQRILKLHHAECALRNSETGVEFSFCFQSDSQRD